MNSHINLSPKVRLKKKFLIHIRSLLLMKIKGYNVSQKRTCTRGTTKKTILQKFEVIMKYIIG